MRIKRIVDSTMTPNEAVNEIREKLKKFDRSRDESQPLFERAYEIRTQAKVRRIIDPLRIANDEMRKAGHPGAIDPAEIHAQSATYRRFDRFVRKKEDSPSSNATDDFLIYSDPSLQ